MRHGIRGVVAVVHLETGQAGSRQLLDKGVGDDPATVHRPRVRDHGHATGFRTHDLDGPHRVGRVVLDVVGAAATQPPRECLVTVPDDPGRHERVRMCGRPGVALGSTCARTSSIVTGMPSAAIFATIASSLVSRLWSARSSSATRSG